MTKFPGREPPHAPFGDPAERAPKSTGHGGQNDPDFARRMLIGGAGLAAVAIGVPALAQSSDGAGQRALA